MICSMSYISHNSSLFILHSSLLLLAFMPCSAMAQKKDFTYKFYGQVRTDLFYNTRDNSETVDGLFYMFPLDESLDPNGNDLNDDDNSNLYTLYSRVGIDVTGPMLGKAKTSAKIEADFRGSGSTLSVVRLRHAYFQLDWTRHALLVGQTWHPLYGDVSPQILNLNSGAPYQPFSRAPQIRYRYHNKKFMLTAALVWQSQYTSVGPSSTTAGSTSTTKSQDYIKNSSIPEVYFGLDYKDPAFQAGAGIHVSSIVPRTESVVDDVTYAVDERVTGVSGEAHFKYSANDWLVAGKTVLSTNLSQTSTVGGYGIKSIDSVTGEQEYSPLRISHSWLNIAYGSKWRPALFFGYLKNLGATDDVSYGVLATGGSLDQLATASAELTYNVPNWKFGVEYMFCNAWYGDEFNSKHKATSSHSISNHRIVLTAMFVF